MVLKYDVRAGAKEAMTYILDFCGSVLSCFMGRCVINNCSSCSLAAGRDPHLYGYGASDSGRRLGKYRVAAAIPGSRGSVETDSLVHKLSRYGFECMRFPFTPNDLVSYRQAAA